MDGRSANFGRYQDLEDQQGSTWDTHLDHLNIAATVRTIATSSSEMVEGILPKTMGCRSLDF